MTASAVRIINGMTQILRDAGYDVQRIPVPQLQPDDLPMMTLSLLMETSRPEGDGNAGGLSFITDSIIGVSLVRGFEETSVLDGTIDEDMFEIKDALFTNADFTSLWPGAFFESIEGVQIKRHYSLEGETYVVELRMEITFRTREVFEPKIIDDYHGATVTVRIKDDAGTPTLTTHWDEQDN